MNSVKQTFDSSMEFAVFHLSVLSELWLPRLHTISPNAFKAMKVVGRIQDKTWLSLTSGRIDLCNLVWIKHVLAISSPTHSEWSLRSFDLRMFQLTGPTFPLRLSANDVPNADLPPSCGIETAIIATTSSNRIINLNPLLTTR